jgi:hypothetical protein
MQTDNFNSHDCRMAEILQGAADPVRLAVTGAALCLQTRHALQAFADGALAHFAAMQLLAIEA